MAERERELRAIDMDGDGGGRIETYPVNTVCQNCGDIWRIDVPKGTPVPFAEALKGYDCRHCGCEALHRAPKVQPSTAIGTGIAVPRPLSPAGGDMPFQSGRVWAQQLTPHSEQRLREMQRLAEAERQRTAAQRLTDMQMQAQWLAEGQRLRAAENQRDTERAEYENERAMLLMDEAREVSRQHLENTREVAPPRETPVAREPQAPPLRNGNAGPAAGLPENRAPVVQRNEWGNWGHAVSIGWDHAAVAAPGNEPRPAAARPEVRTIAQAIGMQTELPRLGIPISAENQRTLRHLIENRVISTDDALRMMGIDGAQERRSHELHSEIMKQLGPRD